jgi:hypothetical protein
MRKLIDLIKLHKERGEQYVLLLGNGASICSGVPPWKTIIEDIVRKYGSKSAVTNKMEEMKKRFYDIVESLSKEDLSIILEEYIAGKRPSKGYYCLAQLIKNGYFLLIFTTNFDPYLEDSLIDIGLRPDRDFIKLIVGVHKEGEILQALTYRKPKIKIVKLHGDLALRNIAVKREETYQFHEKIEGVLKRYFSENDLIIFGHSMYDIDLTRCILKEGRSIWYVNLNRPKSDDWIMHAMVARGSSNNIIYGTEADFNNFFCILAREFDLPIPPVSDAHFMLKEEYLPRRITIPYSSLGTVQQQIGCNIKEASPSTTQDFKDYVKLKVCVELEYCPECTEKEKRPIDYSFEVGWSDKFIGFNEITCHKGHKFLVAKRLNWMIRAI